MKIKYGSTRAVYLIGNLAVKRPRFYTHKFKGVIASVLEGWLCNRNERNWSKSKVYDFLCPVKFSLFGSFIIIMKRTEEITSEEFVNVDKLDFGGYEHKRDSYGKIGTKIVIIDYGN